MIEPVAALDLLPSLLAAAAVVLGGFGYALGVAASCRFCRYGAGLAYVSLALGVAFLVRFGNLRGWWLALAVLWLVGYGLAPVLILRLHRRNQ